MLMMISSRNFTLMKEKAEGNTVTSTTMDCLVPLADMLNHNSVQNATYRFDNRQNNFILKTIKKIEKNAEIFINYGHKCNSRFLMNYGFINQDNFKHNTVTLKLHLNAKEDKSVYIKQGIIKDMWWKQKFMVKPCLSEKKERPFWLYFARFVVYEDEHLDKT